MTTQTIRQMLEQMDDNLSTIGALDDFGNMIILSALEVLAGELTGEEKETVCAFLEERIKKLCDKSFEMP